MRFDLLQSISLAGDIATPNDDRAGSARHHAWVTMPATASTTAPTHSASSRHSTER